MGWGSNPSFCISTQTLDYNRAMRIWEERYNKRYGEANISNSRPGRTNYALVNLGGAIALRMYRTRVITWRQNGRIDYVAYDTSVTHKVQSAFGPLRIWSDSRLRSKEKTRFGNWGGTHYPFGDITIDTDGCIYGLRDTFRRVKKEAQAERAALVEQFRKHAVPRILLGEFGKEFCRPNFHGGFLARVPVSKETKLAVFYAFAKNQSNSEIDPHLQYMASLSCKFGRRKITYSTPELASFAAINSLCRTALADSYNSPWHEDYEVEYPPVVVADL